MGDFWDLFKKRQPTTQPTTTPTTEAKVVAGDSAYQTWIKLGNVGTEQDFINSIRGPQGPQGVQGIQGMQGIRGPKGDPGEGGNGNTFVYANSGMLEGLKENSEDNYSFLQNVFDTAKQRSTIRIPNGTFFNSKTLELKDKSLLIIGSGNSNFEFAPNATGIKIIGNSSALPGLIEHINLKQLGENGMLGNKKGHGIENHSLYDLKYLEIKNFGEDGVHTSADVLLAVRSNASFNKYERVFVREIGGNSFYFQGGDASQSTILSCGSWDVSGWAFWDQSMFGNHFDGCMAHASKKGHYAAIDGNNRATFVGCYAEQDSPMSIFIGFARIIGGTHGRELINVGTEATPIWQYKVDSQIPYRGHGDFICSLGAVANVY